MTYLCQSATNAGEAENDFLGLSGGSRGMFQEVGFEFAFVIVEFALAFGVIECANARQAAFEILSEIAVDGGSPDVGQVGDLVVGKAFAEEPKDFHFLLNFGMGMLVTFVLDAQKVFG